MEPDKKALEVVKKHDRLKTSRSNWDSYWQQLAEYFVPKKDNVYGSPVQGDIRENKLYTSVSVQANEDLASALHGMLTNPSSIWFGLSTGDKQLDKNKNVKQWLQDVVRIMTNVMNQSNFQTQIHEVYIDLGSFGTAVMKIEEDDDYVVNFNARPVYEGYIAENSKGMVDTVSYEFKMTLRQIVQEFGEAVLDKHERLRKLFNDDEQYEMTIIHLVEPRTEYNPKLISPSKLPFASYKVLKEFDIILSEKGFHENPYVVTRWSKSSGELYGRSPGMKCLSDAKMLNQLQMYILKGLSKIVDPPVQMPDDGFLMPIKLKSGGVNYYRANSRDRIEPIQSGARPDLGAEFFRDVEMRIKQAFYIDKLQIRDGDRMTTVEVRQRIEEQLRVLGPVLGRQQFELLRPMLERVYGICLRKDLFPPAPPEIADMVLQVEYTSQIARVQRTADVDNISRVIQLAAPLIQSKPEMLDIFDGDGVLRDLIDKFNLPAEYSTEDRLVQEIRSARQEAQQQQNQLTRAQEEADVLSTVEG